MANEITKTQTAAVAAQNPANITAAALAAIAQEAIALSSLAVGAKFESDDLVEADNIILRDCDIVEYNKSNGENVRFAVWAVDITKADKTIAGYHQSGTILTKMADGIIEAGALPALREYGLRIVAKWKKTSGGNDILDITVEGD